MTRRTTIELDEILLERAKRALGKHTTRATVEEALRRAADAVDAEGDSRAAKQREYLQSFSNRADLDALATEQMWK